MCIKLKNQVKIGFYVIFATSGVMKNVPLLNSLERLHVITARLIFNNVIILFYLFAITASVVLPQLIFFGLLIWIN